MGGRSERGHGRSRSRRDRYRDDRGDRERDHRDPRDARDARGRDARDPGRERDRDDVRRGSHYHMGYDAERSRARHETRLDRHDLRENRSTDYAKGYRPMERHEDRYPDRTSDRERYPRESERYNLRQSERGERGERGGRGRGDRWDEPREDRQDRHWDLRERNERSDRNDRNERVNERVNERLTVRESRREANNSDRGRTGRGRPRESTREVFFSDRSAPDVRELRDHGGRAEAEHRPEIQRRNEVKRPKRLSGANDVQLGERRGGERQSQRDRPQETRWLSHKKDDKAHPDGQNIHQEQESQSQSVQISEPERPSNQPDQAQAQVECAKEPAAQPSDTTVALEAANDLSGQPPEKSPAKGDGREDGEICSESSESDECNSEADFDPSEEEAIPIAVAEKAAEAEAQEDPEAKSNVLEAGKIAAEGSEERRQPQKPSDNTSLGGDQRRDFTRTIPVPRKLSNSVKGLRSSGAEIQIDMPERNSGNNAELCLVSVSGSMEEVEMAVSQIRRLQQKEARDSVELHIPKDAKGQKLLTLIQDRMQSVVKVKVFSDQQEYYKVTLCGQPLDIDRAWLVAVKAILGKAEEMNPFH